MNVQILHRLTDAVLFECEVSDEILPRYRLREALVRAVEAGANLAGANLAGAYLADANLAGANLADAYLAGANFTIPPATKEQSIENLDKVREIVLEDKKRLDMGLWHGDDAWRERSCAEEAICGTTHCLAGWLQVCSTNGDIRGLSNPQLAGTLAAPVASKMFFRDAGETLAWLEQRKYAEEA